MPPAQKPLPSIFPAATLSRVNRAYVEDAAAKLLPYLRSNTWVSNSNTYAKDPAKWIPIDCSPGRTLNGKHLSQYVAACAPMHCADGWSYLGRSLSAIMFGDPHRAIHLAYYAELRAALSLLAAEGVGVFDLDHVAIVARDTVERIDPPNPSKPIGTHQMAWQSLEAWSQLQKSGDLFLDLLTPSGKSMRKWIDPVRGQTTFIRLARDWLIAWGMDIQEFVKDRNSRNDSSYRPDGISSTLSIKPSDALSFVANVWRLLEPRHSSAFDNLDCHLLRITLERLFFALNSATHKAKPEAFKIFLLKARENGFTGSNKDSWFKFMSRQIDPDDPLVVQLSNKPASDPGVGALSVISRATLLLRLASGSAKKLLLTSVYPSGSIEFWQRQFAISRGLVFDPSGGGSALDLWLDVEDALEEMGVYISSTNANTRSFFDFLSKHPRSISALGSCDRVALWAMTN